MEWFFRSRVGTWRIRAHGGRFVAMWEDESLGSYHTPEAALDDLVGGHTWSPSSGADSSKAGLPDALSEWARR